MQNFILVYQLKLFFYFLLSFQCDALVFYRAENATFWTKL